MTVKKIIVIDTETSDLKPEEGAALMELAYVAVRLPPEGDTGDMQAWRVDSNLAFSCYIEHSGPVSPLARATHHIDPVNCLPGAPNCLRKDRLVSTLVAAEKPDEMMYAAHNAPFDSSFLTELGLPWICTWQCSRHIWPEAPSHKNQALRYWLDLTPPEKLLSGLEAHRALYDAAVTASLLAEMLRERSPEELLRLSNTPILLQTCNFKKYKGLPWSEVPLDYMRWMKREGVGVDDKDLQYTLDHYLGRLAAA